MNETLAREGLNPVKTKHSLPFRGVLWRREAGTRIERKRVGDNGKGKIGSEAPAFSLFPLSNARLLFFLLLLFSLEYLAGASAEKKEQNM